MSAKNLTKLAKHMELMTTKACSSDTVPVVMMPRSLTMQPFLEFRAQATRPGSNDSTTGISWIKVRLSVSLGEMRPGFARASSLMIAHLSGSGLAMSRLLIVEIIEQGPDLIRDPVIVGVDLIVQTVELCISWGSYEAVVQQFLKIFVYLILHTPRSFMRISVSVPSSLHPRIR